MSSQLLQSLELLRVFDLPWTNGLDKPHVKLPLVGTRREERVLLVRNVVMTEDD